MLFLAPTLIALLLALPAPSATPSREAPRNDAGLQETLPSHEGVAKRHGKGACEGKAKGGTDVEPTSAT